MPPISYVYMYNYRRVKCIYGVATIEIDSRRSLIHHRLLVGLSLEFAPFFSLTTVPSKNWWTRTLAARNEPDTWMFVARVIWWVSRKYEYIYTCDIRCHNRRRNNQSAYTARYLFACHAVNICFSINKHKARPPLVIDLRAQMPVDLNTERARYQAATTLGHMWCSCRARLSAMRSSEAGIEFLATHQRRLITYVIYLTAADWRDFLSHHILYIYT